MAKRAALTVSKATARSAKPVDKVQAPTTSTPVRGRAATSGTTPRKRRATATPSGADLGDRIQVRAYYLWLARGAGDGDALGDWLQAEREMRIEGPTP